MPEYLRLKTKGATYFFTVNTHLRRPLLTEHSVRQALRDGIRQARQTLPFIIDAWVLLPDHLHAIWTLPEDDANYAARWAIIKRTVSNRCIYLIKEIMTPSFSRLARGENPFWQRRYWEHQIRDDLDFEKHVDYLHWNPMKHGHVSKVVDWPYSTFHRFVDQGLYPVDWSGCSTEKMEERDFGE